jgi:intein-encoded DNA endonuclease-like protein
VLSLGLLFIYREGYFMSDNTDKSSSKPIRDWYVSQKHIAALTNLHENTIKKHVKNGDIDIDDLLSISYFIVRKTMKYEEKDKVRRPQPFSSVPK